MHLALTSESLGELENKTRHRPYSKLMKWESLEMDPVISIFF